MNLTAAGINWLTHNLNNSREGVLQLPGTNYYVVSDPELVARLIRETTEKGAVHALIEAQLGKLLVTQGGDSHVREVVRKAITPHFGGNAINTRREDILSWMVNMVQDIPPKGTLHPAKFFPELTLEVLLKLVLTHMDLGETDRQAFIDAVNASVINAFINVLPSPGAGIIMSLGRRKNQAAGHQAKILEIQKRIWETYSKLSEEQLQKDAFGALVSKVRSGNLAQQDALDQIVMLVTAGHETTASAISWMMYLLAQNPDIQSLVRTAIKEQDWGYINTVIEETLRLYPAAHLIVRQTSKDYPIGAGETLPSGAQVIILLWAMHRNQELFPDPGKFNPYRSNLGKTIPFAHTSFASCIGGHLAKTEMQLVLEAMLPNHAFALAKGSRKAQPIFITVPAMPQTVELLLTEIN